jgi:Cupin domain
MMASHNRHEELRGGHSQYPWQLADRCRSQFRARRGVCAPHPAKSAFIYADVISGAIESKVNDGEARIYRAGESWSEPPNAIHSISRNASKTQPAKLLAVFVLDTNHKALTTPIKSPSKEEQRDQTTGLCAGL